MLEAKFGGDWYMGTDDLNIEKGEVLKSKSKTFRRLNKPNDVLSKYFIYCCDKISMTSL